LNFEIENSIGKTLDTEHIENKGIGIENVKKRLDLIYPGAYSLNIINNGQTYKVLLQIQLN
jgi:sensor histidine kinase YesM